MAGLQKEIWIEELKENFYSQYGWLDKVQDWSKYATNNTINFAAVGTDPVVLKNNSTYPIVAAQRTDTALTVVMDYYDTTTSRIFWNREEVEAAYDKLQSVIKQHKQKLIQDIVTECLWNYGPATAAAGAVACTGANRGVVIGSQTTVASTLTPRDILGLKERWDALDFDQDGRILVVNPYHATDLANADISLALKEKFASLSTGKPTDIYGFDVYVAANTPLYTKSTLAKKAFGAAADNTNDCVASVAFCTGQVMKAMGDMEIFYKEKGINPEQRADEVGFQVRFKGVPQRTTNFFQQALVSNRA
jgi:hypothetical protein